jgi:hypothetical protein
VRPQQEDQDTREFLRLPAPVWGAVVLGCKFPAIRRGRPYSPGVLGQIHGGGCAAASATCCVGRAPFADTAGIHRPFAIMHRQALDRYLNQRRFGVLPQNRLCRGVLLLPESHADYLRGRRRQALRTNLRRAAAAGIRCEVVGDPRRAIDDASHVLRRQWGWLAEAELQAYLNAFWLRPETTVTVSRDERGRPLAVAVSVIDDTACLILGAVATRHEARWALHDHLVRILIARGVRYLLADGGGPFGALGFEANVQHYQHLLGYELRHVIPSSARPTTRRRRVVAAVAVAVCPGLTRPPRRRASR